MALLLRDGSVFLHIPKTGGQTVRRLLQSSNLLVTPEDLEVTGPVEWPFRTDPSYDNLRGHATCRMCGVPPDRCFAFIRHPLDWYRSQWAFTVGKRGSVENFLNTPAGPDEIDSVGVGDFCTWVEQRLSAYPEGMVSRLYSTYTDGVKFVGRLENFREDLRHAAKWDRGDLYDVPRVNASQNQFLEMAVYSVELAERTAATEAKAMDDFCYDLCEVEEHIR
jgi:hypothetical protein